MTRLESRNILLLNSYAEHRNRNLTRGTQDVIFAKLRPENGTDLRRSRIASITSAEQLLTAPIVETS